MQFILSSNSIMNQYVVLVSPVTLVIFSKITVSDSEASENMVFFPHFYGY